MNTVMRLISVKKQHGSGLDFCKEIQVVTRLKVASVVLPSIPCSHKIPPTVLLSVVGKDE